MKYVEKNYYRGTYIDYAKNAHNSKPLNHPGFTMFRATAQFQMISDGVQKIECIDISAYNYRRESYAQRYFSSNNGWIWGYVNATFRPVGETRQIEFDTE
jgi:hypothetical protein